MCWIASTPCSCMRQLWPRGSKFGAGGNPDKEDRTFPRRLSAPFPAPIPPFTLRPRPLTQTNCTPVPPLIAFLKDFPSIGRFAAARVNFRIKLPCGSLPSAI